MTNYTFDNLEKLIRAKESDRLVIFVGAGVSMNSGIPSWYQLIETLAKKIDLENSKLDPLKIAQLFFNKRKHRAYYDAIKIELKHNLVEHNPINEQIFKLKPSHIVTTNYDDLFEQLIYKNRELYSIIRENDDLPKSTFGKFLIKMHGCFSSENIVLKEDDYLNYSTNFSLIESFIKGIFSSKVVLFVGFSFDDINLKYILERVNSVLGSSKQQHYIYFNEDKSQIEREYLELKGLHPIFFDEIESITSEIDPMVLQQISDPGQKLFKFLKILEAFDYSRHKIENLPILEQIKEALSQFKDFDFLMPEVFEELYPFNIFGQKSKEQASIYKKENPSRISFNNPKIDELVKWTLKSDNDGNSDKYYEKLYSLENLRTLNKLVNDEFVRTITEGAIGNINDYKSFETFLKRINASFLFYINNYNAEIIELEDQEDCNCIKCCFEKFNFKKVLEIINKNEFQISDFSKNCDVVKSYLIRGYYANIFGLKKIAFDSFKRAMSKAFLKRREVLRFLSTYNLIKANFYSWNNWEQNEFYRKAKLQFNLVEILNSLDVSEIVKNELLKILNDTYLKETDDLLRDARKTIEMKHDLHERGGESSGGNELEKTVINGFRLIRFYESNYLLGSTYDIRVIAETAFETCLISHTIKNSQNRKTDTIWPDDNILFEFEGYHLHPFIHYSSSEWHKKEIKKILGERKIKISELAITDIFEIFGNFLLSYYSIVADDRIVLDKKSNSISKEYTFGIFRNFLELINISNFPDTKIILLLPQLINFLNVINFPKWAEENQLKEFFQSKGGLFSANQIIQLIEIFIKKRITHYIKELVDHVKDDNLKLDVSIEDLVPFFKERSYNYLKALGYIHNFTNAEVQLIIEQHLEEKLMTNFDSITFLQLYEYDCFNKEKLTAKYILEGKGLLKESYPQENSVALNNFLQFISRNYTNPNIQKLAKELCKNTYVDWLLNFDTFDYQYFNLDWFQYFITQLFIKFMKQNQNVKKQLREFLLINKDVELQNQYSRLYLENFEAIQ
jgi:hypothetical protein